MLVAFTTPAALAAKAATATIPIVFTTISDPVQVGLVASFNRPGGNITGSSYQNLEVGPKLLELMREVLPAATAMALLIDPTNPNAKSQVSEYAGRGAHAWAWSCMSYGPATSASSTRPSRR